MRFPTFATSLSPLINQGISVDIHPGDPPAPSKADGPWEPNLVAELWRACHVGGRPAWRPNANESPFRVHNIAAWIVPT